MSRRKKPAPSCGLSGGGGTSTAVPASLASPTQALGSSLGGSGVGLWTATRGSRRTSRSLTEPSMMPSVASPSSNWSSVPLMRGAPCRRSVAMVLWVPASKRARTFAAKSGASRSMSRQAGTVLGHRPGGRTARPDGRGEDVGIGRAGGPEVGGHLVDVVLDPVDRDGAVLDQQVGGARIAVVGVAGAARVGDGQAADMPDEGHVDVAEDGDPRAEGAEGALEVGVAGVRQHHLPEVARHGVDDRDPIAVPPLRGRGLEPGHALLAEPVRVPGDVPVEPGREAGLNTRRQAVPNDGVDVPDHPGPAELPNPVDALGGPRAADDQVAALHDEVGRPALEIGDDRVERREVAVDVGDDRDSGTGHDYWTPRVRSCAAGSHPGGAERPRLDHFMPPATHFARHSSNVTPRASSSYPNSKPQDGQM